MLRVMGTLFFILGNISKTGVVAPILLFRETRKGNYYFAENENMILLFLTGRECDFTDDSDLRKNGLVLLPGRGYNEGPPSIFMERFFYLISTGESFGVLCRPAQTFHHDPKSQVRRTLHGKTGNKENDYDCN